MANLKQITAYLDNLLDTKNIRDSSNNGLQVEGNTEITKIALCVDACLTSFRIARQHGAGLVICHHGLSWKDSLKYVTGTNAARLSYLLKNEISLYVSHLPLDKHPEMGNNIILSKMLSLQNIKPFGEHEGTSIGYYGQLSEPIDINQLVSSVNDKLKTNCRLLKFGNNPIRNIGVISGKSKTGLHEAIQLGLDAYFTGEVEHEYYHLAKENNINVIGAGHYATETVGVKSLAAMLKKRFNIECIFIDAPTGL